MYKNNPILEEPELVFAKTGDTKVYMTPELKRATEDFNHKFAAFEKFSGGIPVLDKGFVRLIDFMGNDKRIVDAARISYNGESKGPEKDKRLLFFLMRNKHDSPFEKCVITFAIKMPLFVAAQFVRHRAFSFNFKSYRYTSEDIEFYFPSEWRGQDKKDKQASSGRITSIYHKLSNTIFNSAVNLAYKVYGRMLKFGIAREMARMILPQNLYTECYATVNVRMLMHFLSLRMDEHAQWEIREYANAMYEIFEYIFPWTAEAYKEYKE